MLERLVIDIRELEAVRFTCSNAPCHAVVTVPVKEWTQPIIQCPSCGGGWNQREIYDALLQLATALRGIMVLTERQGTPFVQFELPRPK